MLDVVPEQEKVWALVGGGGTIYMYIYICIYIYMCGRNLYVECDLSLVLYYRNGLRDSIQYTPTHIHTHTYADKYPRMIAYIPSSVSGCKAFHQDDNTLHA